MSRRYTLLLRTHLRSTLAVTILCSCHSCTKMQGILFCILLFHSLRTSKRLQTQLNFTLKKNVKENEYTFTLKQLCNKKKSADSHYLIQPTSQIFTPFPSSNQYKRIFTDYDIMLSQKASTERFRQFTAILM